MSEKVAQTEARAGALKDESARQRWEMFHRAISYAKQSNISAMQEADDQALKAGKSGPILSIAR